MENAYKNILAQCKKIERLSIEIDKRQKKATKHLDDLIESYDVCMNVYLILAIICALVLIYGHLTNQLY